MKFSIGKKSALSVAVLGFMALGLASTPALATTTQTATFGVSATIQATCTITTAPLAFGTYTGLQSNAAATVTVTCTNTTPYNVGLDAGTSTGATVTNRSMTGPASALLGYHLYSDSGRSVNWGTTIGTDTVTGTGTGIAQPLTVYGQIPAGQYFAPGLYSDTITASVIY